MWYATVSNKTRYYGATTVLDSYLNASVSYTPPVLRQVRTDGVL